MRGTPLTLVALLLTAPLVASLPAAPPATPALPPDLSDGDLLRLLAAHQGIALREPRLVVPRDATLEGVTLDLARRAGVTLTDAQCAELRDLDPRVAAPTLALLLAVGQAWDLRDEAFARVPPQDEARLRALDPASHEAAELAAPVDMRPLYEAAILLLDTLEGAALPALQDAARTVPWPAAPLVDNPVLRLGGAGNDAIATDRILQIDPAGNDLYRNNAGASTLLDPATLLQTPIAVSVDLAGDDVYDRLPTVGGYRPPAQGSGLLGVGVLVDVEGEDSYSSGAYSNGAAGFGIGILREVRGHDAYVGGSNSLGTSAAAVGILRDDGGSDTYHAGSASGGASIAAPIFLDDTLGLLWDRAGGDFYYTRTPQNDAYGWVGVSGTGLFIDEGSEVDFYQTTINEGPWQHGCNDCTWESGLALPPKGRGYDNSGGLPRALAEAPPYLSQL